METYSIGKNIIKKDSGKQKSYPVIKDAGNILLQHCQDKMRKLYGENPPKIIQKRLDFELFSILAVRDYCKSTLYLIAKYIVDYSVKKGFPTGIRGTAGSSFVAFLLGITGINPLKPHYLCDTCKHVEFISDDSSSWDSYLYEQIPLPDRPCPRCGEMMCGSVSCDIVAYVCDSCRNLEFVPPVASGFDLPDKRCPVCNGKMHGDGHNILFESFDGLLGEKVPDFDLNVTSEISKKADEILQNLLPDYMIIHAGIISSQTKELRACPDSWMIIPKECMEEVPVEYLQIDGREQAVTKQDFKKLQDRFYKQDILRHSALDRLLKLEIATGISFENIPMNDPKVCNAFYCENANTMLHDIPEFGTDYVRKMIYDIGAGSMFYFSDLVRISGLSHEVSVWIDNAEKLIKNSEEVFVNVIATREDVFNLLIEKGAHRKTAYQIMEAVTNGNYKNLLDNGKLKDISVLDLPEWYIDSLQKIEYLLPKSHAVNYAKIAVQMMWYKINYPFEFQKMVER